MIRLFKYEDYEVKVEPEALILKPFKKIWDRDKSKTKERAMMELGFVYFFCDPRSDYQYLEDGTERLKAIKDGEGLPAKWEPDKDLKAAMEFYESFLPMSALLLKDTEVAVSKLRNKLKNVDLDEVDEKGRPVTPINTYISTLKQVPELTAKLKDAENIVFEQMHETGEARGAVEKSLLDDSLDD